MIMIYGHLKTVRPTFFAIQGLFTNAMRRKEDSSIVVVGIEYTNRAIHIFTINAFHFNVDTYHLIIYFPNMHWFVPYSFKYL